MTEDVFGILPEDAERENRGFFRRQTILHSLQLTNASVKPLQESYRQFMPTHIPAMGPHIE